MRNLHATLTTFVLLLGMAVLLVADRPPSAASIGYIQEKGGGSGGGSSGGGGGSSGGGTGSGGGHRQEGCLVCSSNYDKSIKDSTGDKGSRDRDRAVRERPDRPDRN